MPSRQPKPSIARQVRRSTRHALDRLTLTDTTERLLSAHTACRRRRRSLRVNLIDLLRTQARGPPAPLLA
jgi:hypothetical protein